MPAVVLLALSLGGPPTHSVAPPAGTWVITRANVELLESFDAELAAAFFDGPQTVALDGYGDAIVAEGWASLAAFEADVDAGLIPDEVTMVMYDPEAWEHTPLSEQLDPARAMAEFAELARSQGYEVLMTPHPGLVTVPGAVCAQHPGESVPAAFVRCGLPAAAAVSADIVDLQLQSLQQHPARYREWVAAAARQSRRANPQAQVLAHLTTRLAPDPTVLYAAWRSVQPVVDGCYIGVPQGARPRMAIGFLRMISVGPDRRR
jgi:hypothetical protein